jgi:hypothetical protein
MPTYSNSVLPSSIGFGDGATVINSSDTLSASFKSAQVALQHGYSGSQQRLSVEVVFSGSPGTFTLNLQTADTDADANYQNEGANITSVTNNVARLEVSQVVANFARLVFSALQNSVTATAKISS